MSMWGKMKRLYNMVIGLLTGAGGQQSLPGVAHIDNDPNLTKISDESGISWQAKRQKWIVQARDKGIRRTIGRRYLYDDALALKRAWEELNTG